MINKIKSKILASVKSKRINIFLVFIMLSFCILLLTKLSKDYTKTIVFNINKINVPEDLVVIKDSTNVLDITLKTHGFNLLKYYINTPEVIIDFNNLSNKDSIYYWAKNEYFSDINNQLDKDISILTVTPDTLKFRYDVNEVKKVPIVSNTNITFSPGFDVLKGFTIEPDSVRVIGPSSLVDSISFIKTESLELEQVKSSISERVNLITPDLEQLSFSTNEVLFKAQVERFTEGVFNIPVNIINVSDSLNIKYFPKSINISYYTSLSAFKKISVRDFKVVCDFSKIGSNTNYLTPEVVKQPENIKSLKMNQKRIEFIITE